ncbi:hypothetical protein BDV06DRAFT_193231 [Aspergillus oleicola]
MPVSQAVYTSQGPLSQPYSAPIIPALENPFPSYESQIRDVKDYQAKTSASETGPKTSDRRQHRRSDSTPIFASDPLESVPESELKRRFTGREQTASVSFDLTREQEDKQLRTERLERLKHDLGRRDRIQLLDNEEDDRSAAAASAAAGSREREYEAERERDADKRSKDTWSMPGGFGDQRYKDREYERERERERQKEADRRRAQEDLERRDRDIERDHDWAGPVVAGAMGAVTASTILSGRSSASKDDASDLSDRRQQRREQRRAERRRTDPSTVSSVISELPERPKLPEVVEEREHGWERFHSASPTDVDHFKTSASRGVGSKKAKYDDYATFFTPDEIRHSPDHSRQSTPTMPTIIEIEPKDESSKSIEQQQLEHKVENPFKNPLADYTGPSTNYRELDRLPWPVPVLQVIEPTPPHSVSGDGDTVRGAESPVVTAKEYRAEKEPEKPTASRVSWGEHQTHEYEVPSTSSERSSIDFHDAQRDFTFPETSAHDPHRQGYSYVSPTAVEVEDVSQHHGQNQDLEFAATVAAAAQAAGFDPALVTEDPIFRTRTSPPGSETRERSISPTTTERKPLRSEPPSGKFHGYVEGEVQSPETVRPDAPRSQFFADQPIFRDPGFDSSNGQPAAPQPPAWGWGWGPQPTSTSTTSDKKPVVEEPSWSRDIDTRSNVSDKKPASEGGWGWESAPKSTVSDVKPASEGPSGQGSTSRSKSKKGKGKSEGEDKSFEPEIKPASEDTWERDQSTVSDKKSTSEDPWGWESQVKSAVSDVKPASEDPWGWESTSKSKSKGKDKSKSIEPEIKPASEGPWSRDTEKTRSVVSDVKPASEGPWGWEADSKSAVSDAKPASEGPWGGKSKSKSGSEPKPAVFDTKPSFVESPIEQPWGFGPKPAAPEPLAERAWGFETPTPDDQPVVEHVDRVEPEPTKDFTRSVTESRDTQDKPAGVRRHDSESTAEEEFNMPGGFEAEVRKDKRRSFSPARNDSPSTVISYHAPKDREIEPLKRTDTERTETDYDDIPESIADESMLGDDATTTSEGKKKRRKRRSKRESDTFDDTASIASSGSTRSEKRKSTDDKGKKAGGFLASIFGSRVSEPIESKRSDKEKYVSRDAQSEVGGSRSRTSEESSRRHRHHRSSSSRAGSVDGRREVKSEVGSSRRSEESPRRHHHRRDSGRDSIRSNSLDRRREREVRSEVGTSRRSGDSPLRRLHEHRSSSRADSLDGRREVRSEAGVDSPRRRRHHHRTSSGGDSLDGRSRFDDREDRELDRADRDRDSFGTDKENVNVESYKSSRQKREDKRRQRYGDEYEKV